MTVNINRKIEWRLVAAVMTIVFVLSVTAGTIGALASSDENRYMLQDSTPAELMRDFGVICFDTLKAQTHLHSNFITRTLLAQSNSGLRNSYGVYEEFYFENAEKMCGCVSDSASDKLYTGAAVRRNPGGEIFITMNDGSETKLDTPKYVMTDTELMEAGEYSKYADMEDIQRKFVGYSQALRTYGDTPDGVDVDMEGDMNNRRVTVKGSGLQVVSMDYSQLASSTNPIYFEFPDYEDDTVLLVNIDLAGCSEATFGDLILGSKSDAKANDNDNFFKPYNRMYFNLVDSTAADGQFAGSVTFAGRGFGTVLAPRAAVNLEHNWDGCVVSGIFRNDGEFHRVPGVTIPDDEPTTETTTTDTTSTTVTTEYTTTELTTEATPTDATTTESSTTESSTTESTTTESSTTESTTTESSTTESTTTESSTTESTTTESTTTENSTTESTTELTTLGNPPGNPPHTGDQVPFREMVIVVMTAIIGSAVIVLYKKCKR